jgi:hypothetical protein
MDTPNDANAIKVNRDKAKYHWVNMPTAKGINTRSIGILLQKDTGVTDMPKDTSIHKKGDEKIHRLGVSA